MNELSSSTPVEIHEDGFDFDGEAVASPTPPSSDAEKLDERSASPAKRSRAMPMRWMIGASTAVVITAGLWLFFPSDMTPPKQPYENDPLPDLTSEPMPRQSRVMEPLDGEVSSLSVSQGPEGVVVNGHHDLLATLLLQNYPTRSELQQELTHLRGADISQAEFDAFLAGIKNNAEELARLRADIASGNGNAGKDLTAIRDTVERIRGDIAQQRTLLADMQSELTRLKKNSGWYHNRLTKLEQAPPPAEATPKPTLADATPPPVLELRRVQLEQRTPWVVNGASDTIAFITNAVSGRRLRVTRGFDVPGCGAVTDIDPAVPQVSTTGCVITH